MTVEEKLELFPTLNIVLLRGLIHMKQADDRFLAVDIGVSSGRHIVGWLEGGEIKTKEAYRFPNGGISKFK